MRLNGFEVTDRPMGRRNAVYDGAGQGGAKGGTGKGLERSSRTRAIVNVLRECYGFHVDTGFGYVRMCNA